MSDRWQVLCKHGTYDDFDNATAAAIWLVRNHCLVAVEDLRLSDAINERWLFDNDGLMVCEEAHWTANFHVIQPQ